MKKELILYYFESCPFCQRVLNYIERIDKKDAFIFKDTMQNRTFLKELAALNNNCTQVPCLVIDGKPMLESNDIIEYIREHVENN